MMNYWLLTAIGEVDADLVERAEQTPPVRRMTPIRWTGVVAAALVLALGIGLLFGRGGGGIPVDPVDPTQTSPTETEPTGEEPGDGIGGDNWSCPAHSQLYHNFGSELHKYVSARVGEQRVNDYFKEIDRLNKETDHRDTTYPYTDCLSPYGGIPQFIEEFDVTREQFIEAMGWGEFLDHVYQEAYPYMDDGHYYFFTYRDVVDALYGDDPRLTAWVFHNTASYASDQNYQDFYYDDWVKIKRNGDPVWDYIYDNFRGATHTYDAIYDFRKTCQNLDDEDAENIFHLVQFFGIDRETFIDLYGWADKLDEKATEHYPYAPYTYRQFVDAVYGEDTTLRRWVFNPLVFHPEYPTLKEFATLSKGDRFYCAPFTVTPLEPTEKEEICTRHNPKYHDLSCFGREKVEKFRAAYKGKDKEELNVLNFVKYLKKLHTTYDFAGYYDFSLTKDRDKIAVDHGEGCPYTYGQFYYAVFGSDPELTAWVFAPTSTWPESKQWPPQGEWPPQGYGYEKEVTCKAHPPAYHDLSYFPLQMVEEYKASVSSGDEEDYNLFDFINYHHLNRGSVAEYLGFSDPLSKQMDENVTVNGEKRPYTYNQFLDAIYGDDPALTKKVFGKVNATVTTTTTRDPNWGRDEFGNTTTRTQP
ncbi:MAG: hypothetical protein IJO42_03690 [Clostridia bacterium]|nr:hypothetical protein [Clostridia bacterium]